MVTTNQERFASFVHKDINWANKITGSTMFQLNILLCRVVNFLWTTLIYKHQLEHHHAIALNVAKSSRWKSRLNTNKRNAAAVLLETRRCIERMGRPWTSRTLWSEWIKAMGSSVIVILIDMIQSQINTMRVPPRRPGLNQQLRHNSSGCALSLQRDWLVTT